MALQFCHSKGSFKNLQYFVVMFPTSIEIFEFIHTSTSGNIAATPSHSSRLLRTGSSSDSSAKRKKVPKSKKDTVRRPLKRVVTSPEY